MSVLARAELLLQAKNYSGSGDWLDENNDHDAQFGSTSGADTNDPLFLEYAGEKYAYFPGSNGNYLTISDHADFDITGDIDIRMKLAVDDKTPPTSWIIFGNMDWGTSGWRIVVEDDGQWLFQWEHGSGQHWHGSRGTSGTDTDFEDAITEGEIIWIRITTDVDDGSGNRVGRWYTSTDGETWTLHVTDSRSGTSEIVAPTNPVAIWADQGGTSSNSSGKLLRAVIKNGIDGTEALNIAIAEATEPYSSFTENTGKTVTLNRSSSGRKLTVVDQNLFLLGTDDYFEIADDAGLDFAGGDDLTVMLMGRSYDVSPPTSDRVLLAKKDNLTTAAGYALYVESSDDTAKFLIADGTADDEDASPDLTAGEQFIVAGVRNTTDDDIEAFTDGVGSGSPVTDSTTSTLANALPLRLGATSGTAANFFDGEIHAVALWREALTDAEIAQAGEELLLLLPDAPAHRRRRKYLLRTRGRAR